MYLISWFTFSRHGIDLKCEDLGNGRDSVLHDDAHDKEASDGTSIYGGMLPGVVEMHRHNDDNIFNGPVKGRLNGLLKFDQQHRQYLLRCEPSPLLHY